MYELLDEVHAGQHSPSVSQPCRSAQAATALQHAADTDCSRETLTRAASCGRVGATRAAAQMLAGSVPVVQGPDATAATSRLFVAQPDAADAARMSAAVAATRSLLEKCVQPSSRNVSRPQDEFYTLQQRQAPGASVTASAALCLPTREPPSPPEHLQGGRSSGRAGLHV